MKIEFLCPLWGSEHLENEVFFQKVKDAGYDGVEMSLPLDKTEKNKITSLIKQHGLSLIAQHWETMTDNFQKHKAEFRKRLENLATANPLFVNTQTGKDYFTFKQNSELIAIADEVSQKHDVKIIHETHRGKFSFAAHIMASYLKELPDLRIGFDVSHWCNVAETFLHDQTDTVELAISRADHIHARVGFPEGPQVPDPRVPEWEEALQIHLSWWKKIISLKKREEKEVFTITPEFGPYPYMTILPFSQQPITSQWDVNVFMKDFLKKELD
ncbi:TIM barrel protein [Labilibacter sediminis]|nr:TIM barrel protein [Labilibacter sediminis]